MSREPSVKMYRNSHLLRLNMRDWDITPTISVHCALFLLVLLITFSWCRTTWKHPLGWIDLGERDSILNTSLCSRNNGLQWHNTNYHHRPSANANVIIPPDTSKYSGTALTRFSGKHNQWSFNIKSFHRDKTFSTSIEQEFGEYILWEDVCYPVQSLCDTSQP